MKCKIDKSVIFRSSFEWTWSNFEHLLSPLSYNFSIVNFFEFLFCLWIGKWPQTALWAMKFFCWKERRGHGKKMWKRSIEESDKCDAITGYRSNLCKQIFVYISFSSLAQMDLPVVGQSVRTAAFIFFRIEIPNRFYGYNTGKMWLKFFKALVTRYVLSYYHIFPFWIFIQDLGVSTIMQKTACC